MSFVSLELALRSSLFLLLASAHELPCCALYFFSQPPKSDSRVVYVAGAFDMFHAGHVAFLERAKSSDNDPTPPYSHPLCSYGDYLIVGIHADAVVNSHRGLNYPLMSVHERALSVLGCKVLLPSLLEPLPHHCTSLPPSLLPVV